MKPECILGCKVVDPGSPLNTVISKYNGEFDLRMSFLTASLISPMYSPALFDHGVPSCRAHRVEPMSLQNFLTSEDICSPDMSATKD